MTREHRLVTLAFLALMIVGVLMFAATVSRASAVPERPIARLIESDFAPVSLPAPRPADHPEAGRRTEVPEVTARPSLSAPEPRADAAAPTGTASTAAAEPLPSYLRGWASWYPARGYIGAVHSWKWGDDPYLVVLTTISGGRTLSVTVTVSDYCEACVGPRLIDLSDDAFRVLAPLSAGVVRVTLEDLRP